MAIVNGLITLAEAKRSLFGLTVTTANDSDIEDYISATTPIIEDLTGPMYARTETLVLDGGTASLVLPWPFVSVVALAVDFQPVTSFSALPSAGIIRAATSGSPDLFDIGIGNITAVVNVGYATIPPNVKLAAREQVRFLWQQGRQGNRPAFGNDADVVDTPSGYAVPRRVIELCKPNMRVGGFA